MGHFTELNIAIRIKKDIAEDVIKTLQYMCDVTTETKIDELDFELPDHALFRTERWWHMLTGTSYYFDYPNKNQSDFYFDNIAKQWFLVVRSNFKNYDNEIGKFLDWIEQYIDKGDYIGYWRPEDMDMPFIIRMHPDTGNLQTGTIKDMIWYPDYDKD